ncbi:MAG: hypothetical protein J6M30_09435 [Bacteroidales bacterium]|nr:hypothetical protein [Bacteroidales bacterium]MBP3254714.1 hypothetical protein [Bacteroidales bacterium]
MGTYDNYVIASSFYATVKDRDTVIAALKAKCNEGFNLVGEENVENFEAYIVSVSGNTDNYSDYPAFFSALSAINPYDLSECHASIDFDNDDKLVAINYEKRSFNSLFGKESKATFSDGKIYITAFDISMLNKKSAPASIRNAVKKML